MTWPQFADEGAAFHAYLSDAFDRMPVHRFYNTQTQTHFYTAEESEKDFVQRTYPAFAYEGVSYYGIALPPGPGALAKRDAFRLVDQATFGPTRPRSTARSRWAPPRGSTTSSRVPPAAIRAASSGTSRSTRARAASSARARDTPIYRCAIDQLTLFKLRSRFFTNALFAPDQLRQRVAWALSQIFVVSGMKDPDMETAYVQARCHQMLADHAFGNFEGLLYAVTLSPAMGHYLDMVDNAKADPEEGTEPNENYARELLQLFSIGHDRAQARRHAAARRAVAAGADLRPARGEGVRARAHRLDLRAVSRHAAEGAQARASSSATTAQPMAPNPAATTTWARSACCAASSSRAD